MCGRVQASRVGSSLLTCANRSSELTVSKGTQRGCCARSRKLRGDVRAACRERVAGCSSASGFDDSRSRRWCWRWPALRLGRLRLVSEELEEVVRGGDQGPFRLGGGEAAAGEAGEAAGVFGVREDRFDQFGAASVEGAAGLGVKQGLDAVGFGALQARALTLGGV